MQTLNAHFDGRFIVLDEPARLKPNDKVTVLAPDTDDERLDVVMTPELERLLDEGLENLDQAKTTDELSRS